jgi:hypothetical protein
MDQTQPLKFNKLFFVISLIFLIISLGLSGLAFYQTNLLNKQLKQLQINKLNPKNSAQPKKQINTTNWKTYNNSVLGIYFEYPNTWPEPQKEVLSTSSVIFFSNQNSNTRIFSIKVGSYYNQDKQRNLTLKELQPDLEDNLILLKKINSDQYQGFQKTYQPSTAENLATTSYIAENYNSTKVYTLNYLHQENQLENSTPPTLQAILNTLKLQNIDSSGKAVGAKLENIEYNLPADWQATINTDALGKKQLVLSPEQDGGFLAVKVYDYDHTGRRTTYCSITNYCIQGTTEFTPMSIGNISGYQARGLDNSGGGEEYFTAKGNKFYIISTYSPPGPNNFDNNYTSVLDSLEF